MAALGNSRYMLACPRCHRNDHLHRRDHLAHDLHPDPSPGPVYPPGTKSALHEGALRGACILSRVSLNHKLPAPTILAAYGVAVPDIEVYNAHRAGHLGTHNLAVAYGLRDDYRAGAATRLRAGVIENQYQFCFFKVDGDDTVYVCDLKH
ncbi:unnamed protein product [Rotaria sordida]|uniref:Uncharacterized protein n=1 Tax=Rotaria sordida TaxID=392033 RepID=A0A815U3T6_9BILA|nr:unnamed protein product [Rotaria sordida]CAF1659305.1 unnamed protein product [Rotaria sordida]